MVVVVVGVVVVGVVGVNIGIVCGERQSEIYLI